MESFDPVDSWRRLDLIGIFLWRGRGGGGTFLGDPAGWLAGWLTKAGPERQASPPRAF